MKLSTMIVAMIAWLYPMAYMAAQQPGDDVGSTATAADSVRTLLTTPQPSPMPDLDDHEAQLSSPSISTPSLFNSTLVPNDNAGISAPLHISTPGYAPIVTWGNGGFAAYGSASHMPGLMGVETGGLMLNQSAGPLNISISGSVSKYGYFRGLQTTYNIGGEISLRLSDHISLHAFGDYSSPYNSINPAINGFFNTSNFGGFVRFDSESIWGVDVGVSNTYNPSLQSWQAAPLVRPYIKVGDSKLGIDVGGILYNVLRNPSKQRFNPTIGPPIPVGPPPVR
ncbi:MAG: hypothetical protein ACI30K_06720 [Muribaculaceae bacterium]